MAASTCSWFESQLVRGRYLLTLFVVVDWNVRNATPTSIVDNVGYIRLGQLEVPCECNSVAVIVEAQQKIFLEGQLNPGRPAVVCAHLYIYG